MLLIVGLGNPGARYGRTRHNIGFQAVDRLAQASGASAWAGKFRGLVCDVRNLGGRGRVYFLKPQTYMNLSGESVAACARWHKITTSQILVIHDDIDLLPGKIRIKRGGGDGGHNGLKSLDAHLGKDYRRVRIGVGRPVQGEVADYVLQDFTSEESRIMDALLDAIVRHFPLLLDEEKESAFQSKLALALTL